MTISLVVGGLPLKNQAFNNKVYLSPNTYSQTFAPMSTVIPLLRVGSYVYLAEAHHSVLDGQIGMNSLQRKACRLQMEEPTVVTCFDGGPETTLANITFSVDLLVKKKSADGKPSRNLKQVDCDDLLDSFRSIHEMQVFKIGQNIAVDFEGTKYSLAVVGMSHVSIGEEGGAECEFGQVLPPTSIGFSKAGGAQLDLLGKSLTSAGGSAANSIFTNDFNFEKLGIGGLDKEFSAIFRRAFASRIWPSHVVKQMGIPHVRGMLLFGPPGCGKTLIARQIGKALNARDPKIVNGPEILDKYVGGSEEKIRDLFKDAEKEQAEAGDESMLHIIILDEMDAICKSRGTVRDGTGVSDSVVNQLLSKIDGVDSLNNVLLIGMTNRKDMIDDALLRPGRLEVHVEIGLPDEKGRLQILGIHTKKLRESERLTAEVDDKMGEIAARSKNFSGAEIEGLVKSAASFAFSRALDVTDLSKVPDEKSLVVNFGDFDKALTEVEPKFGVQTDELQTLYSGGIIQYGGEGSQFAQLQKTLQTLAEQVRTSPKTPMLSILLEGNAYCGKTAVAAHAAFNSEFPFIRMLTADSLIGHSESSKCQAIHKAFLDAYKSPLSLILIDDIERIIEYIRVGPRFNNAVLQTLLVLLKKPPPEGKKLLVLGTTSIAHLLDDLGVPQAFSISQNVPLLESSEVKSVLVETGDVSAEEAEKISAAITKPLGIKQLLMLTEMTKSSTGTVNCPGFMECLHTVNY